MLSFPAPSAESKLPAFIPAARVLARVPSSTGLLLLIAPEFTLPVLYLRHVAEQVRSLGADVSSWLGRSGLTEQQLDDAALVIRFELLQRLVLDALQMTREPAFGLLVGQRLQANMHGILGYAALSSGSLRQALELFERFISLRFSLLSVALEKKGASLRVTLHEAQPLGEVQRPVLETVILTLKNLLDSISMGGCRVEQIAFPFEAPSYAQLAKELLGCDVRYRQTWAGFSLPQAVLDAPLRMADPIAFRDAAKILQQELERLSANASLAGRVRRLLLEHQGGFPSLQVTARLLHLTPRTLHRRLIDEETSFRELLEDVRHTLALEYLKSGRFGIEEIAYTLGYSDLANFRRAFKRWEGVAPSEYRSALLSSRRSGS
jgi:AraC-like DNA-binding protein